VRMVEQRAEDHLRHVVTARRELVKHEMLARHGHHHVAYVRGSLDIEPYEDRRRGYADAVRRLDLVDRSLDSGGQAGVTEEWLDHLVQGPETAVVTEHERFAELLLDGLKARGLRVPEDVSIVVLESIGPAPKVPWHALHIPRKEIGRMAIDALVELVEDPEDQGRSVVVPCSIVTGETVARVAGR
jgi:DNA-binding LacI/PurR family transcriptional regulator